MKSTAFADIQKLVQTTRLCLADQNIVNLYPQLFNEALTFSIIAQETSKDISQYLEIQNWLLAQKVRRNETVLVIGGGITLDMAGFAAATCLRGVSWQAIPTTLLAMVDASIGGKVGINTAYGKNTIGAFHQPDDTFICLDFLQSLQEIDQKNGVSEILKHLILSQSDLPHTARRLKQLMSESVILEARAIKQQILADDLHDHGQRQLLNLGHTYAHAIESSTHYKIPHGIAVAMGLLVEGHILEHHTRFPAYTRSLAKILKTLQFDLEFDRQFLELKPFMLQDKKNHSGINIASPDSPQFLLSPTDQQWEEAIKDTQTLWHSIQPSNI